MDGHFVWSVPPQHLRRSTDCKFFGIYPRRGKKYVAIFMSIAYLEVKEACTTCWYRFSVQTATCSVKLALASLNESLGLVP